MEIADILDELNSIDRVFEAQIDALTALRENISWQAGAEGSDYEWLRVKLMDLIKRVIPAYRKQVKRMMEDARRTKDNVRFCHALAVFSSLSGIFASYTHKMPELTRKPSSWSSSICNKRRRRSERRSTPTSRQRQRENKPTRLPHSLRSCFSSPL